MFQRLDQAICLNFISICEHTDNVGDTVSICFNSSNLTLGGIPKQSRFLKSTDLQLLNDANLIKILKK